MDTFVKSPNLPQKEVSLIIIDGRVRGSIVSSLQKLGISAVLTDKCNDLYDAVSYHPDMFIHHLGEDCLIAAPNAPKTTIDKLRVQGFNIIEGQKRISGKYPNDIAYNVARIQDYAICNKKYTDKMLLNYLTDMNIKIIDIKQGYAKCSIAVVDREAIITSDDGVYKILKRYDFDVLKINPGSIGLKGLNYGFIGGASGLISKDALSFAGNIALHPDFKKLMLFLHKHGKTVKSLDCMELMDVGTIIPLKEYCIEEIC